MHILFILASWLLEIFFSFYSNYFSFLFNFRFQPIEIILFGYRVARVQKCWKAVTIFYFLIPKPNIYAPKEEPFMSSYGYTYDYRLSDKLSTKRSTDFTGFWVVSMHTNSKRNSCCEILKLSFFITFENIH